MKPLFLFLFLFFFVSEVWAMHPHSAHDWTAKEKGVLLSLSLDSLPPLPLDPSNKVADLPAAVRLGRQLFFDEGFSGNRKVACATCHQPEYDFTDSLPLAHGMGTTARRTMPLAGVAYSPFLFWDGRKDSLWAQALGPIESKPEHGFNRSRCYLRIRDLYRDEYEAIFGSLPVVSKVDPLAYPAEDDGVAERHWKQLPQSSREAISQVYANMGKAIAAFVRRIKPSESRFDRYVRAVNGLVEESPARVLTQAEARGLHLFIGKAGCINCHNGPLFTNYDFHNTALPLTPGTQVDEGRAKGMEMVEKDEFNCLSRYSDADPEQCFALRFMNSDRDSFLFAFKTPSLRNVANRSPYMSGGQFNTLAEVIEHYRSASRAGFLKADFRHADLVDSEGADLVAFLHTLSATPTAPDGEEGR